MQQPKQDTGVADLISAVQHELERAQRDREAAGRPRLFKVSSMDVEIQFVLTSESEVKGGFDIKMIALGANDKVADQVVHKLVLHLDATPAEYGQLTGAYPRRGD